MLVPLDWLREYCDPALYDRGARGAADADRHAGRADRSATGRRRRALRRRPRARGRPHPTPTGCASAGRRRRGRAGDDRLRCAERRRRPDGRRSRGPARDGRRPHARRGEAAGHRQRRHDPRDRRDRARRRPRRHPCARRRPGGRAPLASVLPLGTDVLELEVTPNRPDCLVDLRRRARGPRRDRRAARRARRGSADPGSHGGAPRGIAITVECPDLCPRFTARVFEDVTIGPSPLWLAARLLAAGQRPISNVVDITNYVMLLTGQPMHAFDLDRIAGGALTVRRAARRRRLETLDGSPRPLDEGMVVICDADGPTSLAGIMGGARRRSARHDARAARGGELGRRDAAADRARARLAQRSLVALREGLSRRCRSKRRRWRARCSSSSAARACCRGRSTSAGRPARRRRSCCASQRVAALLGARGRRRALRARSSTRSASRSTDELRRDRAAFPLGRRDARGRPDRGGRADRRARAAAGDAAAAARRRRAPDARAARAPPRRGRARGARPVTRSRAGASPTRRCSTACGWRRTIRCGASSRSRTRSRSRCRCCARRCSARCSTPPRTTSPAASRTSRCSSRARSSAPPAEGPLADEHHGLAFLLGGAIAPRAGAASRRATPTSSRPRPCSGRARRARRRWSVERGAWPFLHPGRAAVLAGERRSASSASCTRSSRAPGTSSSAAWAIDLGAVAALAPEVVRYPPFAVFPSVREDLAVVVGDGVAPATCRRRPRRGGAALARVEIFDVYRGAQVGEGRVSLALHLEFRAPDRTLTDEEVAERRGGSPPRWRRRSEASFVAERSQRRRRRRVGLRGAIAAALLWRHPVFELAAITRREDAGRALSDLYPHHRVPLELEQFDPDRRRRRRRRDRRLPARQRRAGGRRAAGARRAGARPLRRLPPARRRDYEHWYVPDPHPELIGRAVYGLTELNRAPIARAGSSPARAASRPPRSSRSHRSRGPA